MAAKQEPELRAFVRKCAVIPFDRVCGSEFDLMKAATIRPKRGEGAVILQMNAGFTTDFLTQMKSYSGVQDLEQLLLSSTTSKQEDLIGLCERMSASSGHAGLNIRSLFKASGKGATSSAEEDSYSLTDIKVHSLNNSPYLMPFLQKHMPAFISGNPTLVQTFAAKPTVWKGSVDKVLAFVVTKLAGKAGRHREVAQEMSGEASGAAAPLSAPAAEASGGFAHASSLKDQQNAREGILGASFCLVHLRKTHSSDGVKINDTAMVQQEDDPLFYAFLRRIKLKEFRSLVTGRPNARLGFLTEGESTMDDHETLNDHVATMQGDARSLALGGWDGVTGLVNLKCHDDSGTLELHDEQRVKEGSSFWASWFGSWNFIYSAPREELSTMFRTLKEDGSVQVSRVTVVAMSPAFPVDTRGFLPIYHGGGTREGEVPGAVVRDYDGAVFIFPVEGCANYKSCVTVYDEHWEVQESIVHVNRSDIDQINRYQEKGFHEIKEFDNQGGEDDKIVMGRHKLALLGEDDETEDSIFRVPPTNATGDAASVAFASSMPSLRSVMEGARPKKQQKTKE